MRLVLTNGGFYARRNQDGGIEKTNDVSCAHVFDTVEQTRKAVKKAPSKLRGYFAFDLDTNTRAIATQSAIKPHRAKFGKTTRQSIYHNSNCRCQICGKLITYEEFTVDHIIPLAKGGTNDMDNLQSSCLRCNKIKADILPDDFNETIQNITLYNMTNHYNKSFAKSIIKIYLKNIFK